MCKAGFAGDDAPRAVFREYNAWTEALHSATLQSVSRESHR